MKHVWMVYIMPIIDYCSQLWAPRNGGLLTKMEKLQKDFFGRIPEISNFNYWEQLKIIKMFSISRCFERYKIIYARKILNGDTPNCGLRWENNIHKGNLFNIRYSPNGTSSHIKGIRLNSFQVQGPELFNILPKEIRDSTLSADS